MALTTTTKSVNKKISDLKKKVFTSATYRSGSSNVFGTCPSSCSLNPYPSESTMEFDWDYANTLVNYGCPKNGSAFTYTHFDDKYVEEFAKTWTKGKTVINVSRDTLDDAVVSYRKGIPTTVTTAIGFLDRVGTYKDISLTRCPAEYKDEINCANCRLCANPKRSCIVVFTGHGSAKNKVGDDEQGGCYGTSGPVAWAWKKTMSKANLDENKQLTDWVANDVPSDGFIRHHVVGDLGKETS
tara:strand:- start:308 stop:1030 length:723 start_codon:yes stop_codon:yes gene_type:complete